MDWRVPGVPVSTIGAGLLRCAFSANLRTSLCVVVVVTYEVGSRVYFLRWTHTAQCGQVHLLAACTLVSHAYRLA